MDALYPFTCEVLDALSAHVAVLDESGTIIAVNSRWRRFGRRNGASSDCVGENYLYACAEAAREGDRTSLRVQRRLRRLLDGELSSFTLAYHCANRTFRLRATRLSPAPLRVLLAREDITNLLTARRKLHTAVAGLTGVRDQHAARVGAAHEALGQRLAAIGLAAHAIERAGYKIAAVDTIRIAVAEAKQELRAMRHEAKREAAKNAP